MHTKLYRVRNQFIVKQKMLIACKFYKQIEKQIVWFFIKLSVKD